MHARPNRVPVLAFILLCGVSAACAQSASTRGAGSGLPTAAPKDAPEMRVRSWPREQRLLVANPDARESAAWRVNDDLASKAGVIPEPTGGYLVTHRVLLRADARDLGAVLAGRDFVGVEPLDGAPGFWCIEAGSVRAAAALADDLARDARVEGAVLDLQEPTVLRTLPTDPGFSQQWHLLNSVTPIADANVEPAWNAGFTGVGVTIAILEDGWETTHPDLAPQLNVEASQFMGAGVAHGTAVAGVAAAAGNNDEGGVGAAYGAQLSQLFRGTNSAIATAFGFRNDLNDIKNNSWGPSDNGTIWYMDPAVRAALENAVATGRDGKGAIFVWAAGNGGTQDRVDYDPYASSRFTISVGAVGDEDRAPSYNERGSSMFAVSQSDGNVRGIYTTINVGLGEYISNFGGTSSAAPLASGVIAMMLQANPALTWRDVQHVLARTARQCDPSNSTWETNGAGHHISYSYGFGAIDAGAAVAAAQTWENVGPEVVFDSGVIDVSTAIPDAVNAGVSRTVEVPDDIRVESVELIVNATTNFVGDLRILMTSPSGTPSLLANNRSDSNDNYVNYLFTSRRLWDESSVGTWTVNISDRSAGAVATWQNFRLKIYGTANEAACFGDLNGDRVVGPIDLQLLLADFGVGVEADLDGNGATDAQDLASMLSVWGSECP